MSMSEPQTPKPTVASGQPADPLARQRERIAAAQARRAGVFAANRQSATMEARAASKAAAAATAEEIEHLLALAGRMVHLPHDAIADGLTKLRLSSTQVTKWRMELDGHVFDRNAAEIEKSRQQLEHWIGRVQFDQARLLRMLGVPLFPEPMVEPAVPPSPAPSPMDAEPRRVELSSPAPAPAPAPEPPVESVTSPVEVPVPAPAQPSTEPAPAAPAT